MKTKHMPNPPWIADGHLVRSGSRVIADVVSVEHARLISAAPEMFVEMERYLSIAKREEWYATVSELERIITKATGSK